MQNDKHLILESIVFNILDISSDIVDICYIGENNDILKFEGELNPDTVNKIASLQDMFKDQLSIETKAHAHLYIIKLQVLPEADIEAILSYLRIKNALSEYLRGVDENLLFNYNLLHNICLFFKMDLCGTHSKLNYSADVASGQVTYSLHIMNVNSRDEMAMLEFWNLFKDAGISISIVNNSYPEFEHVYSGYSNGNCSFDIILNADVNMDSKSIIAFLKGNNCWYSHRMRLMKELTLGRFNYI